MNFLRLQFSEKTAIRDFVNLTMGDREEELRRGSCSGEVGRSPAGWGIGGGVARQGVGRWRGSAGVMGKRHEVAAPARWGGRRREGGTAEGSRRRGRGRHGLLGVLLFGSLQEQQWWGRRGYGHGEGELMGKMERGEEGRSYRGGGRLGKEV